MPDKPALYFSVTGSTAADGSGDADCTYSASTTNADVIKPFYASLQNVMSGLTVSLKLHKSYYLTVYATEISPSSLLYGSHTTDTVNTSYTSGEKTHVGLSASDANYLVYYKYRERLIQNLKDDAVLKGTACIYTGTDAYGNIQFRKNNSSGDIINSISVVSNLRGISGTGRPVFVFNIPATNTLAAKNMVIDKLRVKWTSRTCGVNGKFEYDLSAWQSSGQTVEFKPYVAVGDYDVDINFLNASGNDVFTMHDTLLVWKNQKSYLLGNGSFSTASITADTARDGSVDDKTAALIADSVQRLEQGIVTPGVKGYAFTADDVSDFQRTVFYVSGNGGVLPSVDSANNGSLLKPFKTVKEAFQAIAERRTAGYDDGTTDWNIVLDGAEASAAEVSFTNLINKNLNITLRNFSSARAKLSQNIEVKNQSASADFNLYLTNVDWAGSYTSYRMKLGTDVYLSNTALCSNIATPASANGAVVLYVEKSGVTRNGTFYIDAGSDTTSTVMNIEVLDQNTVDSRGYGHNVLSYRYHSVNDAVIPSTTFITVNPTDRFKLSDTYRRKVDNTTVTENILDVDSEYGSTYGCEVVKPLNKTGVLSFEGANYSGTVTVNPYSFNITAGQLYNSGLINVTVNVRSADSVNYPVNTLLSYLQSESSGGTLNVFLKDSQGLASSSAGYVTVNYPVSYVEKANGTCDYSFSIQLNSPLNMVSGQRIFYLYMDFSLGSSSPSVFNGIFRIIING